MNIPTRKKDDELMMEGYDPNDKAYKKRTPEAQAEYEKRLRQFRDNSKRHHEKNKEEREARGIKAPSDSNWYNSERTKEREDAEDESVETLLSNQKENMLVWNSSEPKLWTAVSIESGEPKGYYADVTAIGDGRIVASVFDCINIARDEARANGEDFDEEEDAEQHLADFIEDYSATSYTQEIEDAEDEDAEGAAKVAGKVIKGTAKLAGKAAFDAADAITDFAFDGQLRQAVSNTKDGIKYVKSAYEDAEGETLTDQFMRFASKVSALEEGRPVDVDALRLELNALDAKLEALGGTDEDYPSEDQEKKTRIQNFLINRAKRAIGGAYRSASGATRRTASANVKSSQKALADAEKAAKNLEDAEDLDGFAAFIQAKRGS